MPRMPSEPEAFAEQVATLLRRIRPTDAIDLVGPRELLVNGRRLDLENLFRMVRHEPDRGTEIVEHFLDQLFGDEAPDTTDLPFEAVRARIMPRIQPESIFRHLSRDLVAHIPYVNGTVIVFVHDLPNMTVSVTTEQCLKWGVHPDDLDLIARENLREYNESLEFQAVESREGGHAVIIGEQDGYDAARLLLDGLWERLAPELGGDFYVAIPARDMFLAMSRRPPEFVARVAARVQEDFRRMPYPITPDLFYVTRDGVAGTRGALGMAA